MIPVEESALDSLIALADKGLYEAKKQGRNRIILKTGELSGTAASKSLT